MCIPLHPTYHSLLTSIEVTGDTKYLDRAASAIDSFNKYLAAASGGFAGLNDVNSDDDGFWDVMESFWFAEVLKYLCVRCFLGWFISHVLRRYLTFDDPNHISLDECRDPACILIK